MTQRSTMSFGKIKNIRGIGSSIVVFLIEDDEGTTVPVPAEGRLTVDALTRVYGDAIDAIGQQIEYEVDDCGLLLAFAPAFC